jgi:hypothetical protein
MSSTVLPIKLESLKDFRRRNGNISHSYTYRLAGEGKIRLVKLGSKTLVDVEYSQRYFDSLPEAKIKPDKRSKAAASPQPGEAA